jgi:hypothetical protein
LLPPRLHRRGNDHYVRRHDQPQATLHPLLRNRTRLGNRPVNKTQSERIIVTTARMWPCLLPAMTDIL